MANARPRPHVTRASEGGGGEREGRRGGKGRREGKEGRRTRPHRALTCQRGLLSFLTGDAENPQKLRKTPAGGAAGLQPSDVGPPRGSFCSAPGRRSSAAVRQVPPNPQQTSPGPNRLVEKR